MSDERERRADEPDEMELLLPWHVNRTLPAGEEEAIRAALKGSARLEASLATAVEDDAAVKESAAALGAPGDAVLDRILRETGTSRRAASPPRGLLASVLAALTPPRLAYAAGALALLAVVQGGAIAWLATGTPPVEGPSLASEEDDGTQFALVRPASGVTAAQFAAALAALDLRIADGPTAEGYFVLRHAGGAEPDAGAIIAALKGQPAIFETVIPMEQ